MKIMMVQGGFGAGGAEKIMAMLAAHRQKRGDQVIVAGMEMPASGSFFPYPEGVDLRVLAADAPRNALLQLRRMRAISRLITQERPDLIVSFLTKINVLTLGAALGSGIPVMISERNNPLRQSRGFWRMAQNIAGRRARAIIMQTRAARADLPAPLRRRARVIPNPCKPVGFAPHQPAPGAEFHFIATGRLDRQKGFDLLIAAFAALPPDLARARLTIFGEGPARPALEQQIRTAGLAGRVTLPGLSRGAGDWLGAGDALVMSSRYEGFPNVLAEATCSGLPAISVDCPYGPAEIIAEGENGLLVPEGDVPALGRAMTRLARDPALCARLSRGAAAQSARLMPARILARWDEAIAAALDQPPPVSRAKTSSS